MNYPVYGHFFDMPLYRVSVNEVHGYMENVIRENQKALILNYNIRAINLALKLPWFKKFYQQAQMIFCDGDGVRWGLKILGIPAPVKMTYDRWIWQLSEFGAAKGFSFYFLGAKPGIAKRGAERLRNKYPHLQILGEYHGHFDHESEENEKVIQEINRLKPDILILGFGMPLQEKWLMKNLDRIDAHIFLTGGAVFEYAAGTFKSAPQWMIRMQLEWLFRLLYDPRRLFKRYVTEIPYFFYKVFLEKWKNCKDNK